MDNRKIENVFSSVINNLYSVKSLVFILGLVVLAVLLRWVGVIDSSMLAVILLIIFGLGFGGLVARTSGQIIGIESTPNICGGSARIAGTRIPVWVLEQARRLGTSEKEILAAYPRLTAKDLAIARAYVVLHQEEIEKDIKENEEG